MTKSGWEDPSFGLQTNIYTFLHAQQYAVLEQR